MDSHDLLKTHAEWVRSSGALGRRGPLLRLFEFLLERTLEGRAPKEIEIAVDVFGKDASYDVSQDSLVRVYVHKLRRKLDDCYARADHEHAERLIIPKGEYRLALEPLQRPSSAGRAPVAAAPARPSRTWWLASAAALVTVAVLSFALGRFGAVPADDGLSEVRRSAVWAPLLTDDRPIYIVVGDYYIFGERSERDQVERLVRDFSINSREELEQHRQRDPQAAERYVDLDLGYLPTSSAFALAEVMPVLARAGERVRVVLASELDPNVFRTAHVVYVGYLSGLGMLSEIVFAGSRFSIGATYDELIDRASGTQYVSEAGMRSSSLYRDYGYFSVSRGPNGNRHIVVAGTRDTALTHMAEIVTSGPGVAELLGRVGEARAFEALYEVYGVDRANIDGKLVLASPLEAMDPWSEEDAGSTGDAAQSAASGGR